MRLEHIRTATGVEKKCVLIISLVILAIFYHTLQLRCRYGPINEAKFQESLKQVVVQLETLRKNHTRLILRLQNFPGLIAGSTLQLYSLPGLHFETQSPTEEYESLRRRIHSNTNELWYYVSHQLRGALNENLTLNQRQTIVNEVANRKRWLLSDQERLPKLDGHEEWRHHEAASVSDFLQRRLHYLQNPSDCRSSKKLVCQHDMYGFGCNLHHIVYCLVYAYALERTLVLADVNKTNPMNKWTNIFHPVSETCTDIYTQTVPVLSENTNTSKVIYLPVLRRFHGPPIQPYFVPKDLAQRIARFNADPYSWWIGQMVKYILKLRRPDVINDTIAKINFKSPIVGVHIRRTDKLEHEAEYHDIDEYMSHVEDYYEQLELTRTVDQRRVYLATDDVSVLKEAIARYPRYKFYGDYLKAKTADMKTRFTSQGFAGLLVDLHMLSLCDYVVCTFSSNVGRMAYELMQTKRVDAVTRFKSLDQMYYFSLNEKHLRTAVMRNKDIAFEIGDLIEYSNGNDTINGTVLRTNDTGDIPMYKTEENFVLYPYPEYKQVPLYTGNKKL